MAEPMTFSFGPRNPRGICSVCGKDAYKGSATKCDEHKGQTKAKGPTTVRPGPDMDVPISVERPGPPPTVPVPASAKTVRAAELQKSILADLNPALVQGFAMICRPIPAENFYTVAGDKIRLTELGQSVVFSDMEASLMSKGLAELEKSPVSAAATAYITPFLPVVYGVLALGVVGFHGYKLVTVREQLTRQWEALNAPNVQADVTPPAEQAAQTEAATIYPGFDTSLLDGIPVPEGNGTAAFTPA